MKGIVSRIVDREPLAVNRLLRIDIPRYPIAIT